MSVKILDFLLADDSLCSPSKEFNLKQTACAANVGVDVLATVVATKRRQFYDLTNDKTLIAL